MFEGFEFRYVKLNEFEEVVEIENICFPPNEACTPESMKDRIENAAELFLVAYDTEQKKIAGFINGVSTDDEEFQDKFFTDITEHKSDGKNVMIAGVNVRPEYRNNGLARKLMNEYIEMSRDAGREYIYLTCLDRLVEMYEKFGYKDDGKANSTWGGEEWHQMSRKLN